MAGVSPQWCVKVGGSIMNRALPGGPGPKCNYTGRQRPPTKPAEALEAAMLWGTTHGVWIVIGVSIVGGSPDRSPEAHPNY